jgi:hypothetical protein
MVVLGGRLFPAIAGHQTLPVARVAHLATDRLYHRVFAHLAPHNFSGGEGAEHGWKGAILEQDIYRRLFKDSNILNRFVF